MAFLRASELIRGYNETQSQLLPEFSEQRYASGQLYEMAKSFSPATKYDIFLSHSYQDARVVQQIRNMLVARGYSVYVDWLEDEHLDRGRVTPATAAVIRRRMECCNSLIYLTSNAAKESVWMPWELGYMDALTSRVAVAPVLRENEHTFEGREYLGLYPYLDFTVSAFFVQKDTQTWMRMGDWLKTYKPFRATTF